MKKTILLSASVVACSLLFVYFYPKITPSSSKDGQPPLSSCNKHQPADITLGSSDNPILRKLAEYEEVCHGTVVDELMTFAAIPRTPTEAVDTATRVAATLKDFAQHSLVPLVVFEPNLTVPIVLSDIHKGVYDEPLKVFFETLKTQGITDQQMGTWVVLPEANTPLWGTTDPHDFVQNVTKLGTFQKTFFPRSKVSLLLNSRTYPNNDTTWAHGVLKDLNPYIADLPPGLVDRFGYQGFPSVARADTSHQYKLVYAKDFVPASLARDAAKELNIKDIWVNTGTFGRIYTDHPASEVRMSSNERRDILRGILEQVTTLQSTSDSLSVNLFAEDKSLMQEHTDWSYWPKGKAAESADTTVFAWFVYELRQKEIKFSLYDSM